MSTALLIITNGETRGKQRNAALLRLTASLQEHRQLKQQGISIINCGVLSGTPSVKQALHAAQKQHVDQILIYPLFMSDGYFSKTALPNQIADCKISTAISLLPLLGSDPALPPLLYQQALTTLQTTDWPLKETRLLIVGHGSTKNTASAQATRHQAQSLISTSEFLRIETAFLEEAPLIEELLEQTKQQPTIIIGYFTGQGLHGKNDIEHAIEKTGAKAIYAGALGAMPAIKDIILAAVSSQTAEL